MTKNGEDEIKVVDKRRFDDEGEEREDAPEKEEAPAAQEAPAAGQEMPKGEMPPVDFITFVLSLSQTAFLSLGLGPEMEPGKSFPVDLQSARWTIEALEMLHEKTKGNLTGEEERIFERLMAELRMAYVQVAGKEGKPS
jgi:hypothetical protein